MNDPRRNEWDQPIGDDLGGWEPPAEPARGILEGRSVRLLPVDPAVHAELMFPAYAAAEASLFTYLPYGPFESADDLAETMGRLDGLPDWQVHAIEVGGELLGFLCYLRIDPRGGVIEIGGITFSPALQRTRAATEAMYLLIANAFELGYRRMEWKCDALNAPSKRAAERLGFTYEGTFRQATHYHGRNRDTAWFSILDSEWPALNAAFESWLVDENFDDDGNQVASLRVRS